MQSFRHVASRQRRLRDSIGAEAPDKVRISVGKHDRSTVSAGLHAIPEQGLLERWLSGAYQGFAPPR